MPLPLSPHPASHPRAAVRVRVLCTVLLSLLSLLVPGAWAGSSSAAVGDLLCPAGNQTVSFNPGLTTTSRTVTITYDLRLGVCASLSHPEITSGRSSGTVVAPYSCQDLLNTSTGTQNFTWNTGATSTLSFTRTVSIVNGQTVITLNGHITSGLFTGDTGVLTVVEPALNLTACQSPTGLTSIAGTSTFVLT
ncbi:hypothetical protein K353_03475 [Kitasatospora sp. SolWspMP-SS2h]|uniref:hypothetical protein n=1 Tax=Kitasatospora sp. SolWspMP-SS2h TaxID=1305729 RepID=UPI000DBA8382|nr:hypothetical protein [Kitasatospora sp. SolWspMP-SS2h]RAJ39987.1 hypothetical protein K353_03475 [Kitasatospora sp. SolWspMP-SS2h]